MSRSNLAMEALFARTPISLPLAIPSARGGVEPTPVYTEKQNPLFAAKGEPHIVPKLDVNHHHYGVKTDDRTQQVARYGRVYKRKLPSKRLCTRTRTDAPPGMRFCRFCNDFLPLDKFYSTVKRYVCRRHHIDRVARTEDARNKADPTELISTNAWLDLTTVRSLFGFDSVNYDRSDMRMLMIQAGIPWGLGPRVLPIDPQRPMRPRNVAVVSHPTFHMLVELYHHTCSRALYIAFVQRCNLLPPTMDVAWPENPWHNPEYRRADIDVGPLLLAEIENGLSECVDRTLMEKCLASEPYAPWRDGQMQLLPSCVAMRARSFILRMKHKEHIEDNKKTKRGDA